MDAIAVIALGSTAAAALSMGSLINVAAARIPPLMEQHWLRQARAILELSDEDSPVPGQSSICWMDHLPLYGYLRQIRLMLAGRVNRSAVVIQTLCAVGVVLALINYGFTLRGMALAGFLMTLTLLASIDYRTMLLPDGITLPLLWAGLAYQLTFNPSFMTEAVTGAIAGYGFLWASYWGFFIARGKEALGYGDFKLMAAMGAWLGWQALPGVLLISAVSALLIMLPVRGLSSNARSEPVPFGPFLALGGAVTALLPVTRWLLEGW